jgi:hypothetical protein
MDEWTHGVCLYFTNFYTFLRLLSKTETFTITFLLYLIQYFLFLNNRNILNQLKPSPSSQLFNVTRIMTL